MAVGNTSDISIWPLDTTERDKESRRIGAVFRFTSHFNPLQMSVAFSRYTRTRTWTHAVVLNGRRQQLYCAFVLRLSVPAPVG